MKFAQMSIKPCLGLCASVLIAFSPIQAIAIPTPQILVPGTSVSITPPEGFKASKLFTGFEQVQSGSSLIVTEMPIPQDAQQKVIEQLSSAAVLKSKGMHLVSGQDTTIDGRRGKLLLVSQTVQGTVFLKWIAVLAQGDRVLIVTTPFPESEVQRLREPLRQAILNLTWKPDTQTNPLEGLPFSFQEAGNFKIAGRMSNTVVLTKNGAQPARPASEPILVLGSAYQETLIPDIAKFAWTRLQQMPDIRDLVQVSGDRKLIAGHKSFEIVAQGYDTRNSTPLTIYQVIIATDKTYYLIQGLMLQTDVEQYLPIFRSIADSVKPKF